MKKDQYDKARLRELRKVGVHAPRTQRELDSIPEAIPQEFKRLGVPLIPPIHVEPEVVEKPKRKKQDEDPMEKEAYHRGGLRSKKTVLSDRHSGETVEDFLARGGQVKRLPSWNKNLGDPNEITPTKLGMRQYKGGWGK